MDGKRKLTVRLNAEERERLQTLTGNGNTSAKRIMHARLLLMADKDHPQGRYKDVEIANALGIHVNTVARTRRKYCRQGEKAAIDRKVRATPPVEAIVDGALEAHLVAICCTPAPEGRRCWTMSLLADELVKRKLIVSIGRETVRKTLKKTTCNLGGPSGSAFPNATRPGSSRRWNASWTPTRSRRTTTSR
jgi:transposase